MAATGAPVLMFIDDMTSSGGCRMDSELHRVISVSTDSAKCCRTDGALIQD